MQARREFFQSIQHRRRTRQIFTNDDRHDPEDVLDGYRTTVSPLPSTPNPLVYAPDGYDDEVVVVCPGFVLEDHGHAPTTTRPSICRAVDHRSDQTILLRSWRTGTSNNSSTAFAHMDYPRTVISGSPPFHSKFTIAPESAQDQAKMARLSMRVFV